MKTKYEEKEVEVNIQFDASKIDLNKLRQVENILLEMGIRFDTGGTVGGCGVRDWEWDWSLRGPVKVFFKRFVNEDPQNRYNREKEEKK